MLKHYIKWALLYADISIINQIKGHKIDVLLCKYIRGSCRHVMALFDNHKKCARCREKGVVDDPCVKKLDCQIYKAFVLAQVKQLATLTYKSRKESGEKFSVMRPLLSWTLQRSLCWDRLALTSHFLSNLHPREEAF